MIWVTWRQHRLEILWTLVVFALLAICTGYVANEIRIAPCPGAGLGYCLNDDFFGQVARTLVRLNLFQYGLVVIPALTGAFIGAPLVAREIENGTGRLAWTQGVTRRRWLLVKMTAIFLPLLAAAAVVGALEVFLVNVQGPLANHWDVFDQQAPMTVASTLFALALGVTVGALVGRSVPAMAVTLLGFVTVRVGIAELIRDHYLAPLRYVTHDTSIDVRANPTAWWLDRPNAYDTVGHLLSSGFDRGVATRNFGYVAQYFQPGDRFWTFQAIEAAILVALSAFLVVLAIYWVTRRVT